MAKTKTVSVRLTEEQIKQLDRIYQSSSYYNRHVMLQDIVIKFIAKGENVNQLKLSL